MSTFNIEIATGENSFVLAEATTTRFWMRCTISRIEAYCHEKQYWFVSSGNENVKE